MNISSTLIKILKKTINHFGYSLTKKGLDYFDPEIIVPEAKKLNLTLCEYLENTNLGGVGKRRDYIITNIKRIVKIETKSILEIGTGTGIFLEKIIAIYAPKRYEIYETNLKWVNYLKDEYTKLENLKFFNADGKSLIQTNSESIDIVTSHGVFVYIPLISTFGYLDEMYRVCKKNGFIIFDCFTDENFSIDTIDEWNIDKYNYDFAIIIPIKLLQQFEKKYNLKQIEKFDVNYHASKSTYYIYQK